MSSYQQINSSNSFITKDSDPAPLERQTLTKAVKLTRASSCIFNANFSLNPLAAAAAPVLITINKIVPQAKRIRPNDLHRILRHELETFEEKAQKQHYRSPVVLAARYFLCAYADEMMESTTPLVQDFWKNHTLINQTANEGSPGERFFSILERASDDPKEHIHLLELAFLCLNLGYQGKYKNLDSKMQELDNVRENLFELIKNVRGNYSSKLYYQGQPQKDTVIQTAKKRRKIPHLLIASGLLIMGLIGVYFPYEAKLKALTVQLDNTLQSLAQTD